MFRTAICISGQPRFLHKGFEHIKKNIIESNENCDVFIHTWHDKTLVGQSYDGAFWNIGRTDTVKNNIDQEIINLYKPKRILIEKPKTFDYSVYTERHGEASPNITLSMLYSIKTANQLKIEFEKENNFTYDAVIRTRFDAGPLVSINVQNYNLNEFFSLDLIDNPDVFCDWINFSNSKNMDVYSNLYDYLEEYWKQDRVSLVPENMFFHHVSTKHKLPVNKLKKSFFLIRDENFNQKERYGKIWE